MRRLLVFKYAATLKCISHLDSRGLPNDQGNEVRQHPGEGPTTGAGILYAKAWLSGYNRPGHGSRPAVDRAWPKRRLLRLRRRREDALRACAAWRGVHPGSEKGVVGYVSDLQGHRRKHVRVVIQVNDGTLCCDTQSGGPPFRRGCFYHTWNLRRWVPLSSVMGHNTESKEGWITQPKRARGLQLNCESMIGGGELTIRPASRQID